MNVVIAGQKWLGEQVLRALRELPGVRVVAVCAPEGDRLSVAALDVGVQLLCSMHAQDLPHDLDLIVAAHSHDFVGRQARMRARFGAIGYHPSLLPIHRGRDAVRWAVRMRERVTGGSVYRLVEEMDAGEVFAQRHVFIRPGDTSESLWRRELAPLGVELLAQVAGDFACSGQQRGMPQDERLATWEPSLDTPAVPRPDDRAAQGEAGQDPGIGTTTGKGLGGDSAPDFALVSGPGD